MSITTVFSDLSNYQLRQLIDAQQAYQALQHALLHRPDDLLRIQNLKDTLDLHRRLNVAVRLGRVPASLIALIARLEATGLQDRYLITGSHALLAYETRAGVRFGEDVLSKGDLMAPARVALVGDPDDRVAQEIMAAADKVRCQITLSAEPAELRFPVFRQFIIGKNGRMMIMPTVDPREFVGSHRYSSPGRRFLFRR